MLQWLNSGVLGVVESKVRVNVWIVRRDKKVAFVEVAVSGGWTIEALHGSHFSWQEQWKSLERTLFSQRKKTIVPAMKAALLPCKTSIVASNFTNPKEAGASDMKWGTGRNGENSASLRAYLYRTLQTKFKDARSETVILFRDASILQWGRSLIQSKHKIQSASTHPREHNRLSLPWI